jgi:hypothetical protein
VWPGVRPCWIPPEQARPPLIDERDVTNLGEDGLGWVGSRKTCVLVDGLLLGLTATTVLSWAIGTHSPARIVLVLLTACLVPGAAVLTRLSVSDPLEGAALAVGIGLTLEAIGTLGMIWTGFWRPGGWASVLVAAASLVIGLDLRRNARSSGAAAGQA